MESQINERSRALGIAVGRYRDAFNRKVLLLTLELAVERGVIANYHVKGGSAIEMRHGFGARTTRDVDIELSKDLGELKEAFEQALNVGCAEFTFSLKHDTRPIREDALRVTVLMKYLDRPWLRSTSTWRPS